LAEQREVVCDGHIGFETNDAADIKHDHPPRSANGFPERAWSGIFETCDMADIPAAPSGRDRAEALCPRKGQRACPSRKIEDENEDENEDDRERIAGHCSRPHATLASPLRSR
jgi:hypothetical protein